MTNFGNIYNDLRFFQGRDGDPGLPGIAGRNGSPGETVKN